MSKSSTVTARAQPAADLTSVTGALRVHSETFTLQTDQRFHVIDLTERVMTLVRDLHITEGLVNLFSTHTTCAIFINEYQAALVADITTFLERVVRRDAEWRHNDPEHSDCDRMNADSHLRAMLLYELAEVRRALEGTDATLMLLKGAAYVVQDLECAAGRLPADLDILVRREELDAVEQRLLAGGWESEPLDRYDRRYYREWMHQVPPMRVPGHVMELDLHHAILPPRKRTWSAGLAAGRSSSRHSR